MKGGYFGVGSIRGVAIHLHWSAIVAAVFLWSYGHGAVAIPCYLVVILVHELGHAFVARRRGLRVHGVAIHALGGQCSHSPGTTLDGQVVAWGGVLAQGWLYVAASTIERAIVVPNDGSWMSTNVVVVFPVLTTWNLIIAAINLLPIRSFDGYDAWRLFGTLRRGGGEEPTVASSSRRSTASVGSPSSRRRDPAETDDPDRIAASLVAEAIDRAKRDVRDTQR